MPDSTSKLAVTADHTPSPDPPTAAADLPAAVVAVPASAGDRYEMHGRIALGGMGEVLAARDRTLNREVAIKVLRKEYSERPLVIARFIEEARITGQFGHPGIPPIHDLGTLPDGLPFLAMKLIKGRTLADYLSADRPDTPRLLQVFEQVAQTVAYAHSRRVIHRDLKPHNIMVGAFGEVQVMDWGLAKVIGEGSGQGTDTAVDEPNSPPVSVIETDRDSGAHTQAGTLLGTPAYMPPEQAQGVIERIDTRADVFALGAILCEILTGAPPYTGAPQIVRALALTAQLGPALERLAGCGADPELIDLARRCLSADPAGRPADADAVVQAVTGYRTGVAERLRKVELERAEAGVREAERRKRRRIQAALAAAGVLLLLGGGAVAWWGDRQASERRALAAQQQAEEEGRQARNAQGVELLLAQCEESLRADDAHKAVVPLEQAERRSVEGGVDHLKDRLARCRQDLDMVIALDRIDEELWRQEQHQKRRDEVSTAWRAAFRNYGIDIDTPALPEAAQRVNGSLIRDRLLLALDKCNVHWPIVDRPGVLALLEAADPDPFRQEFRNALTRSDKAWFGELGKDPKALEQPPRFAVIMGSAQQMPIEQRERILLPAARKWPGDLTLLMTLSSMYQSSGTVTRESLAQEFRWAQAAVSIRPQSKTTWRHLARAYWDQGALDEGIACYKKALELDPKDPNTLTSLGAIYQRKGDLDEAKKYCLEAIAIAPTYSWAHSSLGHVLDTQKDLDGALRQYTRAVDLDQAAGVENYSHYNNLGWALYRKGDLDQAIVALRDAVRINPGYKVSQANLAFVLKKKAEQDARKPKPAQNKP